MRRGQVLVETALSIGVMLLTIIAGFAADMLISQAKIGESVTVNVCEAYAESPDIEDVVGGWASYLGDWRVRMPRMSISITGSNKVITTDDNRRLHVTPLEGLLPQVFSCESTMYLGGELPFFGFVGITHRYRYTTFRRYGPVGQIVPPSHERIERRSADVLPPVPLFSVVPPVRRGARRRKGQALVEYAMVMLPILPFIVTAVWETLYMKFVMELSARGAVTMTYAAVGPNPARLDITFHTPRGSYSFAPGELIDCDGVSPYSASVPFVPGVTMRGTWGVTITIE